MVSRFTKFIVLINASVPAILLAWDAFQGALGANPVNFAIRTTGILSLIFLMLTLAVTPAMRLLKMNWLGTFRRVMGLYAFFHASIHFLIFFLFDRSANFFDTISEITKRVYLLVGIIGLVIMIPLAVTSTNAMIRRMGPVRWKWLHRLAYLAAIAGAAHFYMLVKADTTRPIVFAVILGVLLIYRLVDHYIVLIQEIRELRSATMVARTSPAKNKFWTGTLRVAKLFQETPHVRTIRLVSSDGSELPFQSQPGQYLNVTLIIDGKTVRRSYTISSPPSRNAYCEISVKREEHGLMSRFLHEQLREGDLLQIAAPAGKFTFTGRESRKIVLIAGGVGITPLMAKIRYLTDIAWPGSIHLIFSIRSENDFIFQNELNELRQRHANLKITATITRDAPSNWPGERGRINRALLERIEKHWSDSRVHLCGPTEMTQPIIETLKSMGIAEEMIKEESFGATGKALRSVARESFDSPSRATGNDATPGKIFVAEEASEASLHFERTGKTIKNLQGKTILELAEEQMIALPYDCRSGICGQCKIKLRSGSVAMDNEDALTSLDRRNGLILACQARCRDDVEVDA